MDLSEATEILKQQVGRLRELSYPDLRNRLHGEPLKTLEIRGSSGTMYQVQIELRWDDQPEKNIRAIVSIDDGGLRAFRPSVEDFIKRPDESFVDES